MKQIKAALLNMTLHFVLPVKLVHKGLRALQVLRAKMALLVLRDQLASRDLMA
jgi:hypothetical protein